MFTDIVTIRVQAGNGGDGKLSFHRSRGNAKGGPDGGDGGRGGDIVLRASHNTNTLAKYRTSKLLAAHSGNAGGTNNRHGRDGESIELLVPPGTIVRHGEDVIAELTAEQQTAIIARGGGGGFGNAHFKSSVRQAPQMAELGEPGEYKELVLELKLLADVGLVGLPNAGKSTLLSMVSNAKPAIANYEFTTLNPNLGVVSVHDSNFLLADIPGLIEGASGGRGLGSEFLRHVERCRVLLHLVDINSADVVKDYKIIRQELKDYKIDLSERPNLVVFTKVETKPQAEVKKIITDFTKKTKCQKANIFTISAVTTMGLQGLMQAAYKLLQKTDNQLAASDQESEQELVTITLDDKDNWQVQKDEQNDIYIISGPKLEKFATRINFDQPDGLRRMRDILKRSGALYEVKRLGGQQGSTLQIVGKTLPW